jgi:2-polyprenyl-3-methyl-5-hydroxy-6-metoxy-1,4-benzoquinol methylase
LPNIRLRNAKHLLKLGAAGFRYPMEIARENPDMEIHIMDSKNLIIAAEKMIRQEYDCNNIKFINYQDKNEDLNNYYDIIFIDSMIEGYSVIENIKRLQDIYNFIKPGGRLIIHQLLMSDCRTQPLYSALKSITLLLNTASGSAYTYSDL